jgi:hypothetical protein
MMGRETLYGRLSVSGSLSLYSTPHTLLWQLGIVEDEDQSARAMAVQLSSNVPHPFSKNLSRNITLTHN